MSITNNNRKLLFCSINHRKDIFNKNIQREYITEDDLFY